MLAQTGELGSGKTTFVQGFLRGIGVRKRSASPTFILFRRFAIPRSRASSLRGFANVFHVDAYRIKNPREFGKLGFKEILTDSKNIVLVEWAEKIKRSLPQNTIQICFTHGASENERRITVKPGRK